MWKFFVLLYNISSATSLLSYLNVEAFRFIIKYTFCTSLLCTVVLPNCGSFSFYYKIYLLQHHCCVLLSCLTVEAFRFIIKDIFCTSLLCTVVLPNGGSFSFYYKIHLLHSTGKHFTCVCGQVDVRSWPLKGFCAGNYVLKIIFCFLLQRFVHSLDTFIMICFSCFRIG